MLPKCHHNIKFIHKYTPMITPILYAMVAPWSMLSKGTTNSHQLISACNEAWPHFGLLNLFLVHSYNTLSLSNLFLYSGDSLWLKFVGGNHLKIVRFSNEIA